MAKAVFTRKVNPTYDDLPEVRYHFPSTYLNQVRAAVGDWIVYYAPRQTSGDTSGRDGRQPRGPRMTARWMAMSPCSS
jgi:putative restriction endonuclease